MNFIREDFLDDLTICDQLIDLYKNSNDKKPGCADGDGNIKPDFKKSTDLSLSPYNDQLGNVECLERYFVNLQIILQKYMNEYEYSNDVKPFTITESFNIQHYKPNEGFFAWHCERAGSELPMANRHLAWMTYLNDLTDEGGTEFYYQKLKVKPQKGKTVIFPVDWTHTHRGIVSKTQDKYIITGWFNFIDKKES